MRRSTHTLVASWLVCLLAAVLVTGMPVAWAPLTHPAVAADAGKLRLDFVDADITDVLKALATQSGANIVVASSVKDKKVTVRLHSVTLEQALALITRPNGLDFRLVEGAYVVAPTGELSAAQGAGGVSESVALKYLTTEDAKAICGPAVPGVAVGGQAKGNLVVLIGSNAAVAQAKQLLADADQPGPQSSEVAQLKFLRVEDVKRMMASALPAVKVEAGAGTSALLTGPARDLTKALVLIKAADTQPGAGYGVVEVYKIKYGDPEELSKAVSTLVVDVKITLGPRTGTPVLTDPTRGGAGASSVLLGPAMAGAGGAGGGYGGAGAGTGAGAAGQSRAVPELAPITTLLVSGPESSVKRAMQLLEQLDVMPKQIALSAMVVDMDDSAVDQLGIDWAGLANVGFNLEEQPNATSAGGEPMREEGWKIGRFLRSPLSIAGSIRALVTANKAKVLANPTVTTMEGRQATIHSGQTVYYPMIESVSATTGAPIYSTLQIPTGVTLIINPWLNPEGDITLTLQPIVSSLKVSPYSYSVGGSTVSPPLVDERRTMTTVRVKQGETLVIGGLVQNQMTEITSKVPLLSKLPLVGKLLFTSTTKQPRRSEVMIFITPREVTTRPAIPDLPSKALE